MTEEEKAAAAEAAAAKAKADEAEKAAADEAAAKAKAAADAKGDGDDKPTDKEAKLLREVMSFKEKLQATTSTLEAIQAEKKAAEDKLAKFSDIDPEKALAALEEQKTQERKQLENKGEYERIIASVNEENAKKLTAKDAEIESLKEALAAQDNKINGLTVGTSFGNSKFIQEELVLSPAKAEALYASHFDIDESGKLVGYDKPAGQSERTKLVDDKGAVLPFNDAIEKIVKADPDFERMQRSKLKPGANSDTKNDAVGNDKKSSVTSGVDRIALALKDKK